MSASGPHAPEIPSERLSHVRQRRFSVAEYHRMIDAGILGEDEHVELLEGEIVEMSPQEKPHAQATTRLNRWLTRALGDEYTVRVQMPLTLRRSEPEPDLAVVRAPAEASARRHPTTALLVVEVADSSARHDLEVKARIYARARIPEYWLVLVRRRVVEVLTSPDPKRGVYRKRVTLSEGEALRPRALPGVSLAVLSLFS